MKIMVCASIGYGGINKIRELYYNLVKAGFEVLNHIDEKHMDYSKVKDFREQKELAKKIVEHDLNYLKKADTVIAISDGIPSFGTGIEIYVAKKSGKNVVLFSPDELPTPWPVSFSDFVATNEDELFDYLHKVKAKLK
jgi:nucleoside 2-deoxyribosyltransferase